MQFLKKTLVLTLVFLVCVKCRESKEDSTDSVSSRKTRGQRLLSVFSVLRFSNGECNSTTNGIVGTCFTASECEEKGGTEAGSCAEGYGKCCIFTPKCGGTSSQNNTRLMLTSVTDIEDGRCQYKICKSDPDVCRIRLDFETFTISQPAADTTVKTTGGSLGDCVLDSFCFSSPGGQGSPPICGINTGYHMIVDASDICHFATFAVGGGMMMRAWDIKVTQYTCDPRNMGGPSGCLQYFIGDTGTLSSFNFPIGTTPTIDGTVPHLSNQNYRICIRREAGKCGICYAVAIQLDTPAAATQASFGLSVHPAAIGFGGIDSDCTLDYIQIPGASKEAGPLMVANFNGMVSKMCGALFSDVNTDADFTSYVAGNTNSICTKVLPFSVGFVTDSDEATIDDTDATTSEIFGPPAGIIGFKLNYMQVNCA